jgi:nucleotide-binding universal stress UspA family protein
MIRVQTIHAAKEAIMKDRTPRRILVAIDFSPASRRALRYATDLALQNGAMLDAVHVIAPVIPLAVGPEPVTASAALMVDERKDVERELQAWCDPGREEGITCRVHLREGDPASQILACVEELYADHLVLGAHGHGALQDFLLGSVARDVQKKATIPVTTLRALESDTQ